MLIAVATEGYLEKVKRLRKKAHAYSGRHRGVTLKMLSA